MDSKIKLNGRLKRTVYGPILLTVLLVLLNIPAYFADVRIGIVCSGIVFIYFITAIILSARSHRVLLSELVNFASGYATVQKQLLMELEIPYAILDCGGKILWVNQRFTEISGKGKGYHKSITSIFPEITRELVQKGQDTIDLEFNYGECHYRTSLRKIYFEDMQEDTEQFITVLYMFDESGLWKSMKENEEQRMVSALVYIDNYEEAIDSIEEVKRSLLSALVDRKVNKYFTQRDGIVRKLEKDKYFVVFKQKYLDDFVGDKFNILEDVKTIKVGNEMAVTLSMGIGLDGSSYNQNYEYSRMAIDLALGRGGDQVVLKAGEKIAYYGGKTRQVEKMTRVKARVKAHALREIIESKDCVIIMGHEISDVDAFGAAIGIFCAARVLEKKAYIVLNEVTSSLRPFKEQFTEERGYAPDMFINNETALELVDQNTLVMVVDTNRPRYTECPELLNGIKTIVVFDHHRQGSEVIENAVLSYIEPYASSTCEMVAEVLQYFKENIHLESWEADCIYAGILIDTDNFNTKTGVRTFEAAAYLRRCGAEVTRVRKLLRDDLNAYKARAEVVRRAYVYKTIFAISICSGEGIESPTIVGAQAANELLNIVGIKASFVLTEHNGKIFISSRSIDEINVQLIMERIGGGGHMNVAGAQLVNCTMQDAILILENTLSQMLEEGEMET